MNSNSDNMLRNLLVRVTEREAFKEKFLGGVEFNFDGSYENYILNSMPESHEDLQGRARLMTD